MKLETFLTWSCCMRQHSKVHGNTSFNWPFVFAIFSKWFCDWDKDVRHNSKNNIRRLLPFFGFAFASCVWSGSGDGISSISTQICVLFKQLGFYVLRTQRKSWLLASHNFGYITFSRFFLFPCCLLLGF